MASLPQDTQRGHWGEVLANDAARCYVFIVFIVFIVDTYPTMTPTYVGVRAIVTGVQY